MRKQHGEDWGYNEIIAYNKRPKKGTHEHGTSFAIFENTQKDRLDRTRALIDTEILAKYPGERLRIIEPGCSAGDICGTYQDEHDVLGIDVVSGAIKAARERYPNAEFVESAIADYPPEQSDILILCEFLEHIVDPKGFLRAWIPYSKYVVISHPVMGDKKDPEEGHFWVYDMDDYYNWFEEFNMERIVNAPFQMGFYPMALGIGKVRSE